MSKGYIFEVSYENFEGEKANRVIQIDGNATLYNFAKIITQAFEFGFDHCFGFYDNFERLGRSDEVYELFKDVGEPGANNAIGVKKAHVSEAFPVIDKKLLFLFDYGDEWHFTVKLKEIKEFDGKKVKPAVIESIGKAPQQYPDIEQD
ncbi:MAG: plasmid pRiA4b ORF-3 family protein [Elusimicrobia bacterium]|nr:plasmid pRiA4b ORF-3 family protein [Elusimicrobiota bacterium]